MAIGKDKRGEPMAIENELLDKLLAEYKKPEDIIGENGLLKQLTKALLERAMSAELSEHLGFAKHDGWAQQRELAQRRDEEDLEGQLRRSRTGDATGPERDFC